MRPTEQEDEVLQGPEQRLPRSHGDTVVGQVGKCDILTVSCSSGTGPS